MSNFYTKDELKKMGFLSVGENVLLSKKASVYSPATICIGDNVRIDDFCILSGNIVLGNNIHISAYSALYGGGKIIMDDYSGISQRCSLISASDDFSGEYMIGAVIDSNFTNVTRGIIHLKKYVQLGANTVVLPNVIVEEGSVTGAMTLVNKDLKEWEIYVGIPAQLHKPRSKKILEKVVEFERWNSMN